jgi:hypothetical protein
MILLLIVFVSETAAKRAAEFVGKQYSFSEVKCIKTEKAKHEYCYTMLNLFLIIWKIDYILSLHWL